MAMRLILVLLAVGMLASGVYLNSKRIREARGPLHLRRTNDANRPGANEPAGLQTAPPSEVYPWLEGRYDPAHSIYMRIPPPQGFRRVAVPEGSFAHWLRFLPLRNRRPGPGHPGLLAWVDLPALEGTGGSPEDCLQRLRSEYLHAVGQDDRLAWAVSHHPSEPAVRWTAWSANPPAAMTSPATHPVGREDYATLHAFLRKVLPMTTTLTLSRDLRPAEGELAIGQVWHHPPAGPDAPPGHAVLVADVVENPRSGERAFLLLQATLDEPFPAVVVNPGHSSAGPWFSTPVGPALRLPGWTFLPDERFVFDETPPTGTIP